MMDIFDILVVGAGPAGLAAAVAAASSGKRVALIDENFHAGGQIWHSRTDSGNAEGSLHPSTQKYLQQVRDYAVTHIQGYRVFAQPMPNVLRAEGYRQTLDITYDRLILATGARERFLPFPGWTLPNVMGVGGLQNLVKSGLPLEDKRVVIAGSGPLLLAVAAYAKQHGAKVVGIFEQASMPQLAKFAVSILAHPAKVVQAAKYRMETLGVPYHSGCWPVEAFGRERVEFVRLTNGNKRWQIPCDYLACAFNFVPNHELASVLGCKIESGMEGNQVWVDEWQQTSVPNIYCAGEPTGIGGLELSLIEGEIAGFAAAEKPFHAKRLFAHRDKMRLFALRLQQSFRLRPELKNLVRNDTIFCRCEDVPFGAVKEHSSWRSAKLHTRCGMGPCQGRICGTAAEHLLEWKNFPIRPPVFPVRLSSLADTPSHTEADAS